MTSFQATHVVSCARNAGAGSDGFVVAVGWPTSRRVRAGRGLGVPFVIARSRIPSSRNVCLH